MLSHGGMMKPEELPPPETLIEYEDGSCAALMFHYASEGDNVRAIAFDHDFEVRLLAMEDDPAAEDLQEQYEAGAHDICKRWTPPVPDGWLLGAKTDSENGPTAWFIRKTRQ